MTQANVDERWSSEGRADGKDASQSNAVETDHFFERFFLGLLIPALELPERFVAKRKFENCEEAGVACDRSKRKELLEMSWKDRIDVLILLLLLRSFVVVILILLIVPLRKPMSEIHWRRNCKSIQKFKTADEQIVQATNKLHAFVVGFI